MRTILECREEIQFVSLFCKLNPVCIITTYVLAVSSGHDGVKANSRLETIRKSITMLCKWMDILYKNTHKKKSLKNDYKYGKKYLEHLMTPHVNVLLLKTY